MIRWIKLRTLRLRRRYSRSDTSLIGRLVHSDLVHWTRETACRGAAVGLFWAFVPIPFQMVPATLFCWLVRANLPLAILCVWLTNPLTLPPILILEYRIGEWLLDSPAVVDNMPSYYAVVTGGLSKVLAGSVLLSSVASLGGYLAMHLAFFASAWPKRRRHERVNLSAIAVAKRERHRHELEKRHLQEASEQLLSKHRQKERAAKPPPGGGEG